MPFFYSSDGLGFLTFLFYFCSRFGNFRQRENKLNENKKKHTHTQNQQKHIYNICTGRTHLALCFTRADCLARHLVRSSFVFVCVKLI